MQNASHSSFLAMRRMDSRAKFRMATSVLMVAVFASVIFFLYQNFYQTIVQANIVVVLKNQVSLQSIDIEAFNRALAVHTYKQSRLVPDAVSDPFDTQRPAPEPVVQPEVE